MLARLSIAWKLMLAAGCAIGALLLLAAAAVALYASGLVRELSNDNAGALAEQAAAQVAGDLGVVRGIAQSMAASIGAAHEAGMRDRAAVSALLKPAASASPMILGAWFMEVPDAFDGQDAAFAGNTAAGSNSKGQFTPYWVNDNGRIALEPLDTGEDYSQAFYTTSQQSGKAAIIEPYPYEVGGKTISMTSITFPVLSVGALLVGAGGLVSAESFY
jgi:methyl-accepting chemotaxis protein